MTRPALSSPIRPRYARGILFGKMVLELGDTASVKNDNNGCSCDIEFKTKGFFTGEYNTIAAKIKDQGDTIGEISGKWSDVMQLKRTKVGSPHSRSIHVR